jgi:hypothetical protein
MDFLRGGFFRRVGSSGGDAEQLRTSESPAEPTTHPEMRERPSSLLRRFPISRTTLPTLFHSRSSRVGTLPEVLPDENEIESPKTPRFALGLPHLPSTRLHLPHLTRTWTNGSNGPASRPPTARPGTSVASEAAPRPSFSRAMQERLATLTPPEPAAQVEADQQRHRLRRFDGADPAELHLAAMAEDGRRRTRGRPHDRAPRPPPKRFLFCFPWIKSRRIRSQILRCFVSGTFLTLLLAVCKYYAGLYSMGMLTHDTDLALSITKNINNSEFTVLLILIILFTTIFFCHGLIRLCMLVVRPRRDDESRGHLPRFIGPGGYAVPRQPIRVVLARDEEAAGIDSDTTKTKPPAYGLWRESVVGSACISTIMNS